MKLEFNAALSKYNLLLLILVYFSCVYIIFPTAALAQLSQNSSEGIFSDPNQHKFPQPLPTVVPIPNEDEPSLETPPTPAPINNPESRQINIPVKKIEVIGNTILSSEDINQIIKKYENRDVTLSQLRSAAEEISQLYLDKGYITSRAIIANQKIIDGIVTIQAIEGGIEQIIIEGNQRVKPSYIRSRVKLGNTTPLRRQTLEDQLRLLKIDPLFTNIEASLRPGTKLGQSILVVRVKEANALISSFNLDNYSPPSVGSERFGAVVGTRNTTGIGDELTAAYQRSTTGGLQIFDFNYRVPINPMEGAIQLQVTSSNSKVTAPDFKDLGIEGNNQLYEISYRQPLIRTPREEFALSLAYSHQDGQTFIFNNLPFAFGIGPDQNGNSRTRVIKFGQDYIKRDLQGAWALRSQFNFGLGIFNATINDAPVPDGRFFSWTGQLQRVQLLNQSNILILQGDIQLTPHSLLPSQQFVVGGGQSVRGFRQNVRTGDNGFRFSVEDRIVLQRNESGQPIIQLTPFIDLGMVWNQSDNPNKLPRQNFLAGAGLGVLWELFPGLNLRVDYAFPFVELDDQGDNAQDNGLFFSLNYRL
ncbi:ShlB/FhaC/HecB family hemolysin secretion/activation protein [Nostoc sp. FACHB-152]|uniref:ShlB/FhaC/HecB family hemolysin secretion/activation protein n=1 Tax=unclassified Nostoc TaxID=2593658 RepID=UPI001681D144|nr:MULTISPECIES: ShlB/FhaC/HecB family hemolysin secretion/activation protein [unclassified Nostoc]MBD2448123.1 ShlB/FhaC/HecB family hemolysin secretion/activation protein [Nostoc sp. FACHB-152]MBD2467129.1 ShlB/FhaC/HecB family hemolysin secretion/activation protein [Nostoc sp. FACHB-145]